MSLALLTRGNSEKQSQQQDKATSIISTRRGEDKEGSFRFKVYGKLWRQSYDEPGVTHSELRSERDIALTKQCFKFKE